MGSSDDQNSSGSSSSDSPPSDSSSSSQSPPSTSSSSSPSPPSSDSGSSSNSGSSPPKDSSSSNGGSSSSSPPSDSGSSSSGNSGNSGSSPPSNSGSSSSGNSGNSPPSDSGSSSSGNSGNSGSSPPSDSGSSSGNSGNSGSSPPSNNNNSNNSPPSNNDSNDNNGNGGSSSNNGNGGNSNNNNNSGGNSNNKNSGGSNNNNNSSNNNNNGSNNNQQKSPPSNHGNNNNQNQNNNNQNNNNNNNNQNNNNNNNNHQSPPRSSHGNGNSPPKSSDDFSPPAIGSGKSHKSSSDNSSPPSSGSSSTPVIVGVVAAAGFLLLLIVLFFLACSKRRKKRQTSSHLMENPDPYRPNGSDYWQSGPKGGDHVLNMPPSGRAPNGGWSAGTPPPMVSSEIASSNFSGPHGPPLPPPHPNVAFGFNKSTFTYEELSAATSGFAQNKLLGQGGFGYVHKGVLPNGKEIAVKSLKAGSGQGDREFGAEVEIISRVHHRHLVSLVGYCLSGERKLLVYEYVANNNLEFHLHGQSSPLEWSNRIKIALGSAKGLAYLHEDCHPKIIHRDIKAANILIDYSFEAKVADFGLAKLNQENVTHVSTRVMGTFGYLAPEYASSGKLTEKSDVFSFGIMLLELITGRRPVDMSADSEEDTLVDWARPRCLKAIDTGDYSEVLDPRLENVNQEEVARMVACAAASVRHSAKKRPKMSQIVRALEGDVSMEDLHEGIRGTLGSSSTSLASSEFDTDSYNAKMKGLRKPALMDSTDYPSSEYGGATNDYGRHSGSSGEMDNKKGMNRPRGPI